MNVSVENIEYTLRLSKEDMALLQKGLGLLSGVVDRTDNEEQAAFLVLNRRLLEAREDALYGQIKSVRDALKKLELRMS